MKQTKKNDNDTDTKVSTKNEMQMFDNEILKRN